MFVGVYRTPMIKEQEGWGVAKDAGNPDLQTPRVIQIQDGTGDI